MGLLERASPGVLSAGPGELGDLAPLAHLSLGPSFQVRLQVQSVEKPQYRGTLHCFQAIIKQESVSGFGPVGVWRETSLWDAAVPRPQSWKKRLRGNCWANPGFAHGRVQVPRPLRLRASVLLKFCLILVYR